MLRKKMVGLELTNNLGGGANVTFWITLYGRNDIHKQFGEFRSWGISGASNKSLWSLLFVNFGNP